MTRTAEASALTPNQCDALRHVASAARARAVSSRAQAIQIMERAGFSGQHYDEALSQIRSWGRVVVHFHPDRCGRDGISVAQALLEEGVYRNQFETGISNGSLTAFPGGPRDMWEQALFGGAYHAQPGAEAERPKYGALDLVRFPDGPIPRFGSCYLVLGDRVKPRTSFTFMGSEHPSALASLSDVLHFDGVMAALLSEIELGGMATPAWPPYRTPTLGVGDLTVDGLLRQLAGLKHSERRPQPGRVLDTLIEAQIHGQLSARDDVEEIVCDPSYRTTGIGVCLEQIGLKYGVRLSWHQGSRLRVAHVPGDFRGERMTPLAERIVGRDGALSAAEIGRAWRSLMVAPEQWADWAPQVETARHLQQLWHTVVHYGSPWHG